MFPSHQIYDALQRLMACDLSVPSMVINWNSEGSGSAGETDTPKTPAAEYVRMSTEHQQYSTDNQRAAIRLYAEQRGYRIVRTYADEGKSGLNVEGRPALQDMLSDIECGRADYEVILVYDVSRLGRFQDPDEAASYERLCRTAGIKIHYCAEQFENDGSIGSSIIKTVKRAMAGEYSRELSVKVFAGQANLIRLGYRQGGAAGFGLRRHLVDQTGTTKAELNRGEQKSFATDRVVLVPGPPHEVAIVREIYDLFVNRSLREQEIAEVLNRRGVRTDLGRQWTRGTIHQLLINEKYVGHNVWARTSFKLKGQHVNNPPETWIRADLAFPPIVDSAVFGRVQSIIAARAERLTDAEMLERLRAVLAQKGILSGLIIDECEQAPSSSTYRSRFGSLLRAYALVGFAPDHDYRYLEINRQLRQLHPRVVAEAMDGLQAAGGDVVQDAATDLLTINGEFTASIIVVRCFTTQSGSLRWKIRLDSGLRPDVTVVIRMDTDNVSRRDYYILPRFDIGQAVLRLCEHNGIGFDVYRFDELEYFFRMAARCLLREAA
jgi:DNA invertase Pin-like site-specific DNA recombinase